LWYGINYDRKSFIAQAPGQLKNNVSAGPATWQISVSFKNNVSAKIVLSKVGHLAHVH
jgi:hypothetical protein